MEAAYLRLQAIPSSGNSNFQIKDKPMQEELNENKKEEGLCKEVKVKRWIYEVV